MDLRICSFLILILMCLVEHSQQEEVDITKIDIFPPYDHKVYSGYLNITDGDKAFFYMFY